MPSHEVGGVKHGKPPGLVVDLKSLRVQIVFGEPPDLPEAEVLEGQQVESDPVLLFVKVPGDVEMVLVFAEGCSVHGHPQVRVHEEIVLLSELLLIHTHQVVVIVMGSDIECWNTTDQDLYTTFQTPLIVSKSQISSLGSCHQ